MPKDEAGDATEGPSEPIEDAGGSDTTPVDVARAAGPKAKPTRETAPETRPLPVSPPRPATRSKPAATPKPAAASKPATSTPVTSTPVAASKPVATSKPAAASKPTAAEPSTTSKPAPKPEPQPTTPVIELVGVHLDGPPSRRSRWRHRRPGAPVTLLDDVSFTISSGQAVGLVGPIGAERNSALIELIAGAVTATSGTVRTCGLTPATEQSRLRPRIGLVSGHHPQLLPHVSLYDSLQLLAEAHQLPDPQWKRRRADLVQRLELASFLALPTGRLTPGRRRRAELAAALIHDPDLLMLDEPTFGLDVVHREQVRTFLHQENQKFGRTLLLSTDNLGDLEQVCSRVLALDGGKLVHDGDLPGLISRAGAVRTLVVELSEADQTLDDIPGAELTSVEAGGLRQRLTFTPGAGPSTRILAEVAARPGIRHLTLEEPALADLVRSL